MLCKITPGMYWYVSVTGLWIHRKEDNNVLTSQSHDLKRQTVRPLLVLVALFTVKRSQLSRHDSER